MTNKRESDLWKQIDKLIFIIAVLGLIILVGAYFIIANLQAIDTITRNFVLNIIINIIPTFLLFIGAYMIFRHIEKLRSERDTDELADKVVLKLTQTLSEIRANNPEAASTFPQVSKLKLKIYDEFDITNRKFEDTSKPQKLIFHFTNRGSNVIHLNKIEYSEKGRGLPKSALLKTYRVGSKGLLIPIDQDKAEIIPAGEYTVELCLAQTYSIETMNSLAGKLGYLTFEITYADEVVDNLLYSI